MFAEPGITLFRVEVHGITSLPDPASVLATNSPGVVSMAGNPTNPALAAASLRPADLPRYAVSVAQHSPYAGLASGTAAANSTGAQRKWALIPQQQPGLKPQQTQQQQLPANPPLLAATYAAPSVGGGAASSQFASPHDVCGELVVEVWELPSPKLVFERLAVAEGASASAVMSPGAGLPGTSPITTIPEGDAAYIAALLQLGLLSQRQQQASTASPLSPPTTPRRGAPTSPLSPGAPGRLPTVAASRTPSFDEVLNTMASMSSLGTVAENRFGLLDVAQVVPSSAVGKGAAMPPRQTLGLRGGLATLGPKTGQSTPSVELSAFRVDTTPALAVQQRLLPRDNAQMGAWGASPSRYEATSPLQQHARTHGVTYPNAGDVYATSPTSAYSNTLPQQQRLAKLQAQPPILSMAVIQSVPDDDLTRAARAAADAPPILNLGLNPQQQLPAGSAPAAHAQAAVLVGSLWASCQATLQSTRSIAMQDQQQAGGSAGGIPWEPLLCQPAPLDQGTQQMMAANPYSTAGAAAMGTQAVSFNRPTATPAVLGLDDVFCISVARSIEDAERANTARAAVHNVAMTAAREEIIRRYTDRAQADAAAGSRMPSAEEIELEARNSMPPPPSTVRAGALAATTFTANDLCQWAIAALDTSTTGASLLGDFRVTHDQNTGSTTIQLPLVASPQHYEEVAASGSNSSNPFILLLRIHDIGWFRQLVTGGTCPSPPPVPAWQLQMQKAQQQEAQQGYYYPAQQHAVAYAAQQQQQQQQQVGFLTQWSHRLLSGGTRASISRLRLRGAMVSTSFGKALAAGRQGYVSRGAEFAVEGEAGATGAAFADRGFYEARMQFLRRRMGTLGATPVRGGADANDAEWALHSLRDSISSENIQELLRLQHAQLFASKEAAKSMASVSNAVSTMCRPTALQPGVAGVQQQPPTSIDEYTTPYVLWSYRRCIRLAALASTVFVDTPTAILSWRNPALSAIVTAIYVALCLFPQTLVLLIVAVGLYTLLVPVFGTPTVVTRIIGDAVAPAAAPVQQQPQQQQPAGVRGRPTMPGSGDRRGKSPSWRVAHAVRGVVAMSAHDRDSDATRDHIPTPGVGQYNSAYGTGGFGYGGAPALYSSDMGYRSFYASGPVGAQAMYADAAAMHAHRAGFGHGHAYDSYGAAVTAAQYRQRHLKDGHRVATATADRMEIAEMTQSLVATLNSASEVLDRLVGLVTWRAPVTTLFVALQVIVLAFVLAWTMPPAWLLFLIAGLAILVPVSPLRFLIAYDVSLILTSPALSSARFVTFDE